VGGGKSSIAERLKQLMQEVPFYAIKGSPVNESPLGLFDAAEDGPSSKANTASRAATSTASSAPGP
jgi:predicted Ser/Thr protein kinase